MLGFDHTDGEFPDMRTLSTNLRLDVNTVFVSILLLLLMNYFQKFRNMNVSK